MRWRTCHKKKRRRRSRQEWHSYITRYVAEQRARPDLSPERVRLLDRMETWVAAGSPVSLHLVSKVAHAYKAIEIDQERTQRFRDRLTADDGSVEGGK